MTEPTIPIPPAPKYDGPERRTDWHTPDTCDKFKDVKEQLEQNRTLIDGLKAQLKVSQLQINGIDSKLDENNVATNELLAIIKNGKGFFNTLGFIGKWIRRIILWVAPVVTALISLWYAITQKPN